MKTFKLSLTEADVQPRQAHPSEYLLHPELAGAVEVAFSLGQPLLLTGEPGTGKTRLAHKLAWDLSQQHPSFLPEPLIFHTKTQSVAQDLFYTYDALGHFQAANLKTEDAPTTHSPTDFIQLQALGKAIALTNESEVEKGRFLQAETPRSSLVLIDEIDKAPRDFPNDILHEIEHGEFSIKEAGHYRIKKGQDHRILVIMTSNSEKNLPEPFLRRCVFYHIPFPSRQQLLGIVASQLGEEAADTSEAWVDHFLTIRDRVQKKKPATAELIAWLRVLELQELLKPEVDLRRLSKRQQAKLRISYAVLAKHPEDAKVIKQIR
ncbi:MAG: MoxR family ATPase [Bacteroidota bacterium]